MLKLYRITYIHVESEEYFNKFVLGYSHCHAINLLYREFDSHGDLNNYRHVYCEELSCIHPAQFKNQ